MRPAYRVSPPTAASLLVLTLLASVVAVSEESPHWDKSACITCHNNPAPVDASDLRVEPFSELCADCHDNDADSTCPHPTNLPTQDLGQLSLPDSYRSALVDERIVCTSCHSMRLQCTGGRRERYRNPAFLRNGPFRHPGEACFECHETERYSKLNPHLPAQDGDRQSCLFCHSSDPNPATGTDSGYRLVRDQQCTGCHTVAPHPVSIAPVARAVEWTHLVVPTREISKRMRAARDRTGITLPLDARNGAVTCTTCHNVHDPDSPEYPLRSEDGTASRLRMLDICEACHDQ